MLIEVNKAQTHKIAGDMIINISEEVPILSGNKIINKIGGVKNYHILLNYKIELCKIYAKKKSFNFDLSDCFINFLYALSFSCLEMSLILTLFLTGGYFKD